MIPSENKLTGRVDAELWSLAEAVCNGTIAPEQYKRLNSLLSADEDAARFYAVYLRMHGLLLWRWHELDSGIGKAEGEGRKAEETEYPHSPFGRGAGDCLPSPFGRGAGDCLPSPFGRGAGDCLPSPFGRGAGGEGSVPEVENQQSVLPAPYSVLRTPHSPFPSFLPSTPLGNVAFSYAMSAVLVCLGLWIFSLVSASSPRDAFVNHPTDSPAQRTPNIPSPAPEPRFVSIARITGMVDCVWVNADDAPFHDRVVQGTKYMLKSGLMEITYHTGARVILQGPCTYEVESTAGGYLSLGKLTARVESRSRLPDGTSRSRLPSGTQPTDHDTAKESRPAESRPAGGTYFAVRTPTATVTDLGTEFGVEVGPDQSCEVHVICGIVETCSNGSAGGVSFRERLIAGEGLVVSSIHKLPRRIASGSAIGERKYVLSSNVARDIRQARLVSIPLRPTALVASAYLRVWDAKGKMTAENDRQAAFRVATDGIFGRGEKGDEPRSSFQTGMGEAVASGTKAEGGKGKGEEQSRNPKIHKSQNPSANPQSPNPNPSTSFIGLLYDRPTRFDRIKVFMARQTEQGGSWATMPRLFILKDRVDSDQTPPESDPAHWREVPIQELYGKCGPNMPPGASEVFEFVLTGVSADIRTGFGWAVGGVPGNGSHHFISVTDLRAYCSMAPDAGTAQKHLKKQSETK